MMCFTTTEFQEKVKTGSAHYASSGFGGKGLERLDKDRDLVKKIQKKVPSNQVHNFFTCFYRDFMLID